MSTTIKISVTAAGREFELTPDEARALTSNLKDAILAAMHEHANELHLLDWFSARAWMDTKHIRCTL